MQRPLKNPLDPRQVCKKSFSGSLKPEKILKKTPNLINKTTLCRGNYRKVNYKSVIDVEFTFAIRRFELILTHVESVSP